MNYLDKMELFDDSDMSWLTQVPSLEYREANFDVGSCVFDEKLLDLDVEKVVSLEDESGDTSKHVLYDNVVCEDISSDEELDKL